MPGPLATMYGVGKKQSDDEFAAFLRTHPNWGADDYSRALFATRLGRHPGGQMPGDEGPIILDQAVDSEIPGLLRDMAMPYQNMGPTGGLGPRPFRDPEQAGPAPPGRDTFARVYGK